MTVAPPWSLRECHIQGKSPAWPRPPQTSLICGAMRQFGHYADSTSFVPAVRVVRRLSKADPSVTRQTSLLSFVTRPIPPADPCSYLHRSAFGQSGLVQPPMLI